MTDEQKIIIESITEEKKDNIADLKGENYNIHCLLIIGHIEGHQMLGANIKTTKYEQIMPQLAAIEESNEIEGLLLMINTVGGDVEAGLAIAELVATMKKPTVAIVLGGGHSIGVPLAVSAQKTFMAPTASMTIHPVRLNGTITGSPQTFNYFYKIQEKIVNFVTSHSKVSRENFIKMMMETGELASDIGTILDGKEAVEAGLADSIGGLSDALSELHSMIDKKRKNRK